MKKGMILRLVKLLTVIMIVCLSLSVVACVQNKPSNDSSSGGSQNQSSSSSSTGGSVTPGPIVPDKEKGVNEVIVNGVRIQLLSETLVRIENEYDGAFEDRPSYIIQNRKDWYKLDYTEEQTAGEKIIKTDKYFVHVPNNGSAEDVYITAPNGKLLWNFNAGDTGTNVYLPSPSDELASWYFTDSPRVIPSESGYSSTEDNLPLQGWDFSSNATDIFVFLPEGNYTQFCNDYITLTGASEMTPLQMLGYWDSRWYAYSAETALQQIKDYTDKGYSIDVLVIDTDWRVGASLGYQVNETLFPDMKGFLEDCEELDIDIVFNDHPEPVQGTTNGLDKAEVDYRNNELTLLLSMGLDYWWYDRNWSVCLNSADPDISVYAFGMYAYQWITRDHLESITDLNEYAKRALIMGNVDGCLHGKWNYASDLSSHRYSIQWTGDIGADSTALEQEIYASVFGGAEVGLPYMSSDIGGHTQAVTNEMYVRWIQYGALSTICRVHCTTASYINGQEGRMPWLFGDTAEEVAKTYVGMRYRLLPLYYNLARENYDTGLPIMRRLDILYPDYVEASANDEYLLGDYLLVAPINEATINTVVDGSALYHIDANGNQKAGLKAEYFNNNNWSGSPSKTTVDKNIDFNWGNNGPMGVGVGTDNFSARWTGYITLGDKPAQLSFFADDTVIVYIDGKLAIDGSGVYDTYLTTDTYAANSTHTIEVRYAEFGGGAHVYMYYVEQQSGPSLNSRTVFIPDGTWIDVWSGARFVGPATYTVSHTLKTSPVFVREGALIPLARNMKNTHEKDWSELVLDVYPSKNFSASATLYEDDTETVAYKNGESRSTLITMSYNVSKDVLGINVGAAQGAFAGKLAFEERTWTVRLHTNPGWGEPYLVKINGEKANLSLISKDKNAEPFAYEGGALDGDIYIFTFTGSVYDAYNIEISYDSAVDSAINTEYDKTEVPFNLTADNAGSAIDLDQAVITDWISYGEENADGFIQKQGGESIMPSTSYDMNWISFDNFFTKSFNAGNHSTGSSNSQKDFSFELKVKNAGYFVIYAGGYQCTAKLTVRDRAGNVKTVVFGNVNDKFIKRVIIEVPESAVGSLYVTYSTSATEPAGTGSSTVLSLIAVIASTQIPEETQFEAGSISAEVISTASVSKSVCLSEAGADLGEETLDWMQFGDDGGVTPVQKINSDIIKSAVFNSPGIFNDYQIALSYYDGLELGAHTGTTKGTCTPGLITLNFNVNPSVKHIILYTGTWKATNTVEVYNRAGQLLTSSVPFSAGSSALNRIVTIAVNATTQDSLIVFIRSSNENGGNVSLAGVAVTGTYQDDATVSLSATATPTSESISLTGNSDWKHFANEDEMAGGTAIGEVTYNHFNLYENFASPISYTDGVKGEATALKTGGSFDCANIQVFIDENTSEIILYATAFQTTAGLAIVDENGRTLLSIDAFTANSAAGMVCMEIRISVQTAISQSINVIYYKGASTGNVGLAAVAVK